MKKFLMLSFAVLLVKIMLALDLAGSKEQLTGNVNIKTDTVRKKEVHPFPGFPGQRSSAVKKKALPIGTLKIRSEIPARFSFDKDTTLALTPYHLITIYKVTVGPHTITFRDSLMERRKTIMVDTGTTGFYTLRKDSTVSDSVSRRNFEKGHKQHIVSWYEPFSHAISFDFLPGASFNGRGIGPDIRFEIGYYFNRVLKLGIGTGYICNTTHLNYSTMDWFEHTGTFESDNFGFPLIPLYLDLSLNFKSNRNTTFLSFNLGASFPLSKPVNCKSTYNGSTYESSTYYLKIDQIRTGFYFGIGTGMKYFFTPFFEGGVAVGFNMSVNTLKGTYYKDPAYTIIQMEHAAPHITTGFGINLMLGFNLDTK